MTGSSGFDSGLGTLQNPQEGTGIQESATEVSELIDAVKGLLIPFIASAGRGALREEQGNGAEAQGDQIGRPGSRNRKSSLADSHSPEELVKLLALDLPAGDGLGKEGLVSTVEKILGYSVNTWHQGFLDKLYSSTNAVGVASELLLSVLNTNVHVYSVSPALTVVEKTTAHELAKLFGFSGPRAGGFTTSGGSASNHTSLVVARNTLFPETKTKGNGAHQFALFTSQHGHYSVEKAAQACGIGSANVIVVPVDAEGRMTGSALRLAVHEAKKLGKTPLYVNATAGTTVYGSYDLFEEISPVCREFGIWFHIDASWGGPVVFSGKHRHKLAGAHLSDSLTVNPHKMMNVPLSCSFLLGPDLLKFHRANTLPAGYLFHTNDPGSARPSAEHRDEVWDLADLTLQCGRRADSLKLALAWIYYGVSGFQRRIEHAFYMASYLAVKLQRHPDFVLLSSNPPPCLQVCFYYAAGGVLADSPHVITRQTREIATNLLRSGFMVDYAPDKRGSFFRVVVNCETQQSTMDELVHCLQDVGSAVGGSWRSI